MSAFMCSEKHIKSIVRFFDADKRYAPEKWANKTPQDLCALLEHANRVSVNHRYRHSDGIPAVSVVEFVWTKKDDAAAPVSALVAFKLIQCLDYQSCETDDWRDSEACAFLDWLQSKAAAAVIRALPAYDAAPWGIS
jgi:hypothetical protein